MAKKEKREPVLTIDNKEYYQEDLSPEQIRIKDHLLDLSRKLDTNIFVQEQLQVSRDSFVGLFRASLEKNEEKAEAKEEREYVALSQKRWSAESGDAMDDSKSEYSLSQLESEKARYDADMARAKAQSDGIAAAIADFKKL